MVEVFRRRPRNSLQLLFYDLFSRILSEFLHLGLLFENMQLTAYMPTALRNHLTHLHLLDFVILWDGITGAFHTYRILLPYLLIDFVYARSF